MKVLHAPVNVGNQPWVLSRHERALGVDSELVVNYSTWFGFPADKVLGTYAESGNTALLRRLACGLSAPFRYDVLHYYFGRSLLQWDDFGARNLFPFLDLKIARRLGRRIFFTLQGCDVRLAGESHARNPVTMCRPGGCSVYAACIDHIDRERRRLIDTILPLADRLFVLNPELAHYVPGAVFLPYASADVEKMALATASQRRRPRVLHAPSDDSIKGSPLIEAALQELAGEFDFEYVAVRKVPHAEALKLYQDADLVIDQVLAGWYGGFAVELMAMGKPVACYLREEDLQFLPPRMRAELPLLPVDPRTLVADLRRIFERRAEWAALGHASREFVLRWHNPRTIARAMVAAYRDPAARFNLSDHVAPLGGAISRLQP